MNLRYDIKPTSAILLYGVSTNNNHQCFVVLPRSGGVRNSICVPRNFRPGGFQLGPPLHPSEHRLWRVGVGNPADSKTQ